MTRTCWKHADGLWQQPLAGTREWRVDALAWCLRSSGGDPAAGLGSASRRGVLGDRTVGSHTWEGGAGAALPFQLVTKRSRVECRYQR